MGSADWRAKERREKRAIQECRNKAKKWKEVEDKYKEEQEQRKEKYKGLKEEYDKATRDSVKEKQWELAKEMRPIVDKYYNEQREFNEMKVRWEAEEVWKSKCKLEDRPVPQKDKSEIDPKAPPNDDTFWYFLNNTGPKKKKKKKKKGGPPRRKNGKYSVKLKF
tara:strand:+ start:41 stop:532 length:492 start_codon:yes stop_codon:yes gene_type:complete